MKIKIEVEKIYIDVYSKKDKINNRNIFKIFYTWLKNTLLIRLFFYPFFLLPIIFILTSVYFIYKSLFEKNIYSIEWIITFFILFMYFITILREIKYIKRTIKTGFSIDYSDQIEKYYKQ